MNTQLDSTKINVFFILAIIAFGFLGYWLNAILCAICLLALNFDSWFPILANYADYRKKTKEAK